LVQEINVTTIYAERGWARAYEPATQLVHIARRTNGDHGPLLFPVCVVVPLGRYEILRPFAWTLEPLSCLACIGWRLGHTITAEVLDGDEP
jgi:hypothetical protein